ncbi:hypothetical protein KFK09_018978 [Dendrobium nobile]|uniref:Transcription factor n=1 Tax=Dendrobium nobile TaxID=94219 RepID=A0A8T3AYL5_DENNO|nr:hypothetical protein KFK09_018978 [Dendrobium nobile]
MAGASSLTPWGNVASQVQDLDKDFFSLDSDVPSPPQSRSCKDVLSGSSAGDTLPSLNQTTFNNVPTVMISDDEFLKLASPFHFTLCLLHSRPEWWTYAIFWRTSSDLTVLCFGDGHFRGTRDDDRKRAAAAVTAVGDVANDSDDAEWFYVVSLTRWFSVGAATAPARAYASLAPIWVAGAHALQTCGCERSSEAQLHGIETLVFIPAAGGVLELGSGDLVGENWALVQQAKSLLFAPDDADPVYSVVNRAQVGNLAGGSSSVDSEHSDSEGPGLMVERRRPKKRGRKPGSVRETPVNHVEAERQRREKLNHRFYALRSVVPNVSRMDKASLLADAVSYIKDLRAKVEELEAEAKRARKEIAVEKVAPPAKEKRRGRYICRDVVVQVPDALQGEDNLRCALLARLEKN